jgi:hypothetical protein
LEDHVKHSLLTTHTAERIRDDLRETGDIVTRLLFGTLYAFTNIAQHSKRSHARRMRMRGDREAKRALVERAERIRAAAN